MQDRIVNTVTESGEKVQYFVVQPPNRVLEDAQMIYNSKIAELLKKVVDGNQCLLLKSQLEIYLDKLGVWTKEDRISFTAKQYELKMLEEKLVTGGLKLSDGRAIAIRMRILRNDLIGLFNKRLQYDNATIESVAEQAKFIFILVNTVLDEKKEKLFKSVEDYKAKETEQFARDCASEVANMFFGYDKKDMLDLPENQWLKTYKFMNMDGILTNRSGQLVDSEGKLVNENGRYIDPEGKFIDYNGRKVDEFGNLIVDESKPFYDDDTGEPVEI